MNTATQQALMLNHRKMRAHKLAAQLHHLLRDYIPDACRQVAIYHMETEFYKVDAIVTTEEERKLNGQ